MKEITQEIRQQLRAPFPLEAITAHPTKTFLSTIKAIYVTERLNDVFGIGKWLLTHEIVENSPDYVSVRGRIELPEYSIRTPDQYGGHGKTGKNTEPADGYKSATTDMMSKCASYLEIGIDVFKGLAKPGQAPPPQPEQGQREHWCEKHNLAFGKKTNKDGAEWYSHQAPDGSWCNEPSAGKKAPPAPSSQGSGVNIDDIPAMEQDDIFKLILWARKELGWETDQMVAIRTRSNPDAAKMSELTDEQLQDVAAEMCIEVENARIK